MTRTASFSRKGYIMSRSALYAANTAAQNLSIGSIVNFGNPVRRFGCNVNLSGGNVALNGTGYYDVDVSITFADTAAGTAVFTLLKDGVAVPGATATITTGTGSTVHSISIPAIVRNTCCKGSVLSVAVTGVAVNVSGAAIVVEKM